MGPLERHKGEGCQVSSVNGEEVGWFVLQNVPLLVLEQESTIPAQWVRTSTSPWSIRKQTSTAGGELQASE